MAGAVAEAGAAEKAAEILKFADRDAVMRLRCSRAGRTHARKALPQLRIAA